MKLEILTISDNSNYGNRLQNYALSVLLAEFGDVHTIRVSFYCGNFLKYFCEKDLHFRDIKNSLAALRGVTYKTWRKRQANFHAFSSLPELKTNAFLSAYNGLDGLTMDDAILVLGSDQIWHYSWFSQTDLELLLGCFAKSDRIITYAASIGLDAIEEPWLPLFRNGWSRIHAISVREDSAASLVRKIAEKDAAVVLDPTLMLSASRWSKVFSDSVPEGDRYVLTYFLGNPSEEQRLIIQRYADSCGARIRCLNDPNDMETYAAGPAEFVELISKAVYVFTDSYHACCFSILFNRPFKVFNRSGAHGKENMNSRMRTLFRLFGLKDLMGVDSEMSTFDWRRVNSLLESHRKESRAWLESALADVARQASWVN